MNKKTLRIAGWALGLSMAVAGIGAAVGASYVVNGNEPMMVNAETASTLSAGANSVAIKINYNSAGVPASNNGVRISSSSKNGSATFSVPAGTTSFGFSAVGWKDKSVTATISTTQGTLSAASVDLTSNSAATGTINANATVEIDGNDADIKKSFTISGVTSGATITLSTSSSEKRAIFWDAWYEISSESNITLDKSAQTIFAANGGVEQSPRRSPAVARH